MDERRPGLFRLDHAPQSTGFCAALHRGKRRSANPLFDDFETWCKAKTNRGTKVLVPGVSQTRPRLREMCGAGRGTRTPDPEITNHVLYQLSYTGHPRGIGHRAAGKQAGKHAQVQTRLHLLRWLR